MEEKIVELLQDKQVEAAIQLYVDKFGVTWSEAQSVIKTYQSELSAFTPNHRSDSAFSMEEVNMLDFQMACGEIDLSIDYLKRKYGIEEKEARYVLSEITQGDAKLPSYDVLNTQEIMDLLSNNQQMTAIIRYRELYDVNIRMAKDAVEKIERWLL